MEFSGITVSHQVFIKRKIERLRTSSHLKVAKRHCLIFESSSVPTSCYQSIVVLRLCIIRDINTVFFERIELGHGLVIQIFSIDQKRLCTRLAIPSQSGLH
jgi:hypothetical protein